MTTQKTKFYSITSAPFKVFALIAALVGSTAWATDIVDVRIQYSQRRDDASFPDPRFGNAKALIGGRVNFVGEAPVYVTLRNGVQSYTALTDKDGFFSFYIFLDGVRYTVEAWTPSAPGKSKTIAHSL